MGVGPPRFGLRPGVGQRPGVNPDYSQPAQRRTIHYPGNDSARYPGRALYTFVRRITQPGTDSTKYPGTDLLIRGAPKSRSGTSLLGGNAVLSVVRGVFHRVRVTLLSGAGAVLGETGLASSAARTTMPVDVSLASHSDVAYLATAQLDVDFASGAQVVDL